MTVNQLIGSCVASRKRHARRMRDRSSAPPPDSNKLRDRVASDLGCVWSEVRIIRDMAKEVPGGPDLDVDKWRAASKSIEAALDALMLAGNELIQLLDLRGTRK
jgi:hypothetical protein